MLKEMLSENKLAMDEAEEKLRQCQRDKENEESRLKHLTQQYQSISDWAKEFDSATSDAKKMILARIVRKITVDRNYHITMSFFVTLDEFQQNIQQELPNVKVEQTEEFYETIAG